MSSDAVVGRNEKLLVASVVVLYVEKYDIFYDYTPYYCSFFIVNIDLTIKTKVLYTLSCATFWNEQSYITVGVKLGRFCWRSWQESPGSSEPDALKQMLCGR